MAIAKAPIGARVLAGNPRPDEFDDSSPEPIQSEWARVEFLIVRDDLSIVEAEFIRPRAWIDSLGLVKGARLDLAVPELEIDGLAEVTAVRDCPPIAEGTGRVVTGRFVTRSAGNVVLVSLANGTEIRATDIHPVWSVDREEWVPAGKLAPGEQVDTLDGPVAVASVERLESRVDVHNIEVHGEHVFRVPCSRRGYSSRGGGVTTTPSALTAPWDTGPRLPRTGSPVRPLRLRPSDRTGLVYRKTNPSLETWCHSWGQVRVIHRSAVHVPILQDRSLHRSGRPRDAPSSPLRLTANAPCRPACRPACCPACRPACCPACRQRGWLVSCTSASMTRARAASFSRIR